VYAPLYTRCSAASSPWSWNLQWHPDSKEKKRIIYAAPMSIFNIQETTVMAMICSIDKDKLIIY